MPVQPDKQTSLVLGGGVFLLLILIDQLAKRQAANIFYNANFAFSVPLPVWLMYVIYFTVLVSIVLYLRKNFHQLNLASWLAWLLIVAGAVANVGERIILGYVRDFIYVHVLNLTGIYNLADFYIIIGIILLVFMPTSAKKNL